MEIDLPEAALKKLEVPMRLIGLAVVLALNLFLDPLSAVGQQPAKVYRIGFLGLTYDAYLASFRQELRDLGYVEGRNLILEIRRAEGKMELFPHYAAELVRLKVDLIVAGSGPATMAARAATLTIPIVMMGSADAVGHGLVASLAKPGGNVTGLTNMVPDLTQKRLQLLRELLPQLSHVGVLSCGRRGSSEGEAQAAAAFLRVQWSCPGSVDGELLSRASLCRPRGG